MLLKLNYIYSEILAFLFLFSVTASIKDAWQSKEADCHADKSARNDGTHKDEILATRRGGFGSSDASMILEIAKTGKIYKQEHFKRLAVFEGILEPENFTTASRLKCSCL